MKRIHAIYGALVALALLPGCDPSPPAPDLAAVEAASGAFKTCAACHGAEGEGNPTLQAPALVNLDSDYLAAQLDKFRSGLRGAHPEDTQGQLMAGQSDYYADDAAVAALVAQIDSFPDVLPPVTFADADLPNGKDRYNMICGACHGPDGVGNATLEAPSLRGIDDWYLAEQYAKFGNGQRGSHADDRLGRQMAAMGGVLQTEENARDVAAYLLSLGLDD